MENGVFVFSSHIQHVTKWRYTYIYTYIYTHIYIHIHTHIYIYTHIIYIYISFIQLTCYSENK